MSIARGQREYGTMCRRESRSRIRQVTSAVDGYYPTGRGLPCLGLCFPRPVVTATLVEVARFHIVGTPSERFCLHERGRSLARTLVLRPFCSSLCTTASLFRLFFVERKR